MRNVLPHEERDFTPWLEGNLDVLSDLLDRPLELVGREVRVGGFEADLQLRVVGEETQVLVENQYGSSDHDHLGKLLTYGAGLGATLFVWLAETVREEHRAALAWLNETTREEVGFFGVELDFVRIATSPPAPRLRVVAQPNGWQKRVRQAARAEARPWTEEELAKKAFLDQVAGSAEAALPGGSSLWRVTPKPRHSHIHFRLRDDGRFWLTAYVTVDRRAGVFCRFKGEDGLALFGSCRTTAQASRYDTAFTDGDPTATISREIMADWRPGPKREELERWFPGELAALANLVLGVAGRAPSP